MAGTPCQSIAVHAPPWQSMGVDDEDESISSAIDESVSDESHSMAVNGSPLESVAVHGSLCVHCSPWQQPMATPSGSLHSMAVHGGFSFNK